MVQPSLLTAAKNHLGKPRRKHEDWFDENDDNIHALLEQKHKTHRALLSGPKTRVKVFLNKAARAEVQRALRKMKNQWWTSKAAEIQTYADSHNYRELYGSINAIYGPRQSMVTPVLSADGSHMISDSDKLMQRWAEYFHSLLKARAKGDATCLLKQRELLDDMALYLYHTMK